MATDCDRTMAADRLATVLVALALLVAVAGCGHTLTAGDRLVRITLTEYRLLPQSVRAPAGRLTIYAHNYGRLTHNLAVMRGARTAALTKPIPPGQSARLVLTLAPGSYLLTSTILSDRDLGLSGTLTITR